VSNKGKGKMITINGNKIEGDETAILKNHGNFTTVCCYVFEKDDIEQVPVLNPNYDIYIWVHGDDIHHLELEVLDTFPADGESDYHWGILQTWEKYGSIFQKIKAKIQMWRGI